MSTNTNLRGFLWNDAGDALSAVTVEARVADADGAPSTSVYATGAYAAGKWDITSLDDAYNYEVKLTSGAQVRKLNGAAKPIYYEVTLVDRLKAGDGTVALPSVTFRNDLDTGFYRYGADQIGAAVGGALSLLIGNKVVFVGDTANAKMTVGLTLNQGAADDEILALKSSDVDHGMTAKVETDTYATLRKYSATAGGLYVGGLTEDTIAWYLEGMGVTDDATKSTSGNAYLMMVAAKKNGTTTTTPGTDANLLAILAGSTTRFIFDAEGTLHPIIGDADVDVIRLSGTTGTPALAWNETRDRFTLSKGLELTAGILFVGDTTNAGMTVGLTINQGANGDEIISLKNSQVAHGMTTVTETDTFAYMKIDTADGGVVFVGLSESAIPGIVLTGIVTTDNTTKTTAGVGALHLSVEKKNGTSTTTMGADANLLSIANLTTTRFIFDAEGSAHADVEWIAYDDHDDVALLNKLDAAMTRDPIKTEFGRFLGDYREQLQQAKIVNFYDNGPRAMLNTTRLLMLLTGAVRQISQRLQLTESRLAALPLAS